MPLEHFLKRYSWNGWEMESKALFVQQKDVLLKVLEVSRGWHTLSHPLSVPTNALVVNGKSRSYCYVYNTHIYMYGVPSVS